MMFYSNTSRTIVKLLCLFESAYEKINICANSKFCGCCARVRVRHIWKQI